MIVLGLIVLGIAFSAESTKEADETTIDEFKDYYQEGGKVLKSYFEHSPVTTICAGGVLILLFLVAAIGIVSTLLEIFT